MSEENGAPPVSLGVHHRGDYGLSQISLKVYLFTGAQVKFQ